jgi:hypothetical protein
MGPGKFQTPNMSKISRYPRKIPPKYEKWLSRFTGSDGARVDYNMNEFWDFFQLHPISDDAKYLEMKLFSSTLHGNAREWYGDLPDDSVTSMNQLEETFLDIWGIKLEYIQVLLQRLKHIKKTKNENIREFRDRFENLLYQIPRSHHAEDKYLVYLYTNSLLVHLGFLLSKKGPKEIYDAYSMVMQIKDNIYLFKKKNIFSVETKVEDPKGTPDTLSLERLISLDIFEGREQVINQQLKVEKSDPNEGFQSHEKGKEFTHASTMVEEREPEDIKHNDEVLMCDPPSNEAIQSPIFPSQEEEGEVSHFPFQDFDNTLFYDSEIEGEMKSLDKVDPPCCIVEDIGASHKDETMIHVISFDEVTRVLEIPAQEEINMVSYLPFQNFDDSLFYDLESEEVLEDPLDALNPSYYDKYSDIFYNIHEFIHFGRHKWDVIGSNKDPKYNIEGHF